MSTEADHPPARRLLPRRARSTRCRSRRSRRSSATPSRARVASQTPWIRGVISLRGKIIPVCDLAAAPGPRRAERPESAKIVIVETATGTAGVIVDDVEEVLTVDADQLEDVPAAGAASIEAIAKIGDRLVDPAQPGRPVRGRRRAADGDARRGLRPPPGRRPVPRPTPHQAVASSSPTTPASCAACSPTRCRRGASTSVGQAADGDEALALCALHRPDALTLDLAMPGLDGIGVLRELRADGSPVAGRRRLGVLARARRPRRRRARRGRVRAGRQAGRRRAARRASSPSSPTRSSRGRVSRRAAAPPPPGRGRAAPGRRAVARRAGHAAAPS